MEAFAIQPRNILENVKNKFEDEYFNTFDKYDLYQSNLYGNYITPPPENERGGHSDNLGTIIYDLHKDYREYRKELLMKRKI